MGDVLYGIDFKNKKRPEPIPTPLDEGLAIIADAMAAHNAPSDEVVRFEPVGPANFSLLTPEQAAAFGNPNSIDDIPWPGMDSANYVAPEKDPA